MTATARIQSSYSSTIDGVQLPRGNDGTCENVAITIMLVWRDALLDLTIYVISVYMYTNSLLHLATRYMQSGKLCILMHIQICDF